jgi:hypothetical protein
MGKCPIMCQEEMADAPFWGDATWSPVVWILSLYNVLTTKKGICTLNLEIFFLESFPELPLG